MSWKYKAAEKLSFSLGIYILVTALFYHMYWFLGNESYLGCMNLYLSSGVVMLLGSFFNFPPSEFYQVDGENVRFRVTGLPMIIKFLYIILGPVLIGLSSKYSDEAFFSTDIFSIIFEILGLLLFISAMYMQINKYLKNRNDFIQFDEQKITWKDDQTGKHEVSIADLKSAIVKAKKVLHLELNNGEKHIIKLDELSLTAYAEVIGKELHNRGIAKP
ncbi:MAG: hypothetical protein ACKO7P_04090 [Bacteroidota bacterium]